MLRILFLVVLVRARFYDKIRFPDESKGIVGGREALAPPEDDPVAFIVLEDHWSRVIGLREGLYPDSYYRFIGLRYAEPPVGHLRFQRPRRVRMTGDISARKFGAHCPQPHPDNPNIVTGSEDCLFLNVFTPKLPDGEEPLPVLLWIHGGGFRRGSGAQYGGGLLARRDLVVVTPNYRLGALGFTSSGDPNLPGNVAMFDLTAVVHWIKDYIHFFGGDPNRIIPFGQGTGGSSAALLALSNVTQGRMAGVISMSGAATSPFAIDPDPKEATLKLAERNGCPTTSSVAMAKCLQQLPLEKLVQADSAIEEFRAAARGLAGMGAALSPAPVVEPPPDARSLPPYLDESPLVALQLGHGAKVPLLVGVTSHETAAAVTGGYRSKIIEGLNKIPDFFQSGVLKNLSQQTVTQVKDGAQNVKNLLTTVATNYKKPLSIADSLNQIIEATSDALFNFPAYQQSKEWLKRKLPTFFYNFEHSGKLSGAARLLKGSPLVFESSVNDEMKAVSHGTDLPYIFEIRTLEGLPYPDFNESSRLDPDDESTRNTFLSLFEQFAKKGSVELNRSPVSFPSFISIGKTATVGASFRECNMALWSGKKPKDTCPSLQVLTNAVVEKLGNVFKGVENPFGKLPSLSFPGLG